MPWDLSPFADVGLNATLLESLLGEHERHVRPGLDRLWSYYRNPRVDRAGRSGLMSSGGERFGAVPGLAGGPAGASLAQAAGLPQRLTNRDPDGRAREIVIENDIGWRVDSLVDFLFGKPVRFTSTAADPVHREEIEAALAGVWEASGGIALLQDFALLGCVYGSADLVIRTMDDGPRIEAVEAPRAVPVLDPCDYRRVLAYVIVAPKADTSAEPAGVIERALRRVRFGDSATGGLERATRRIVEVLSASHRQVYDDGRRVLDEPSGFGELPVVHVQNASQPYRFEGLSDVEPLIPLQDELNTRLSDRAHRVTLQSFNMYLAKGLEVGPGSGAMRIGPGQIWLTDNTDAQIQAFGGDGHSPSEDRHIDELREAFDKTSGVSPVVIGVVRERLGQLSSENALRVTLTGILNKTMRKRITYGRGLERASALVLAALDSEGSLRTSGSDRGVRVEWGEALPTDERTRLSAALMKRDLGVPVERVLEELGYAREPGLSAAGAD